MHGPSGESADLWHRVLVAVVDVGGREGVVVLGEVWVVVLDAVVQDGDDDTLASVALGPGGLHVHVGPAAAAAVEEPLLPGE